MSHNWIIFRHWINFKLIVHLRLWRKLILNLIFLIRRLHSYIFVLLIHLHFIFLSNRMQNIVFFLFICFEIISHKICNSHQGLSNTNLLIWSSWVFIRNYLLNLLIFLLIFLLLILLTCINNLYLLSWLLRWLLLLRRLIILLLSCLEINIILHSYWRDKNSRLYLLSSLSRCLSWNQDILMTRA